MLPEVSTTEGRDDTPAPVGIWDLDDAPISLGGLFMLSIETMTRAANPDSDQIEIAIAGEIPEPEPGAIAAVRVLERVRRVTVFPDIAALRDVAVSEGWADRTWPSVTGGLEPNYRRVSTLESSRRFARSGSLPALRFRPDVMEWGRALVERYHPRPVITVHLKNTGTGAETSDANLASWRAFLQRVGAECDALIVVIGDDDVAAAVEGLDDVHLARETGASFPEQLALITLGKAFIGMAAGPSTVAVYSDVPYAIFKHPAHDQAEMEQELGTTDRLPFAGPRQWLLRKIDHPDALFDAFGALLNSPGVTSADG